MSIRQMILKIPGVKELRESGAVHTTIGRTLNAHRGRFQTQQEAWNSLPPARRSTCDNDEIVSGGIEAFSAVHNFDWPILFYLQKLLLEHRLQVVTDFGGHVGVKFYAFRNIASFGDSLQWQVVDVPAVVREGRRRIPPDVNSLSFFENVQDTAPADVLLCSGSLQYSDLSIVDLVNRMPAKPHTILLNKVAIAFRGEGYFTLENFGFASVPYHVVTHAELDQAREQLGYTLASSWNIPDRDFAVFSSGGIDWVNLIGQAWILDPKGTA